LERVVWNSIGANPVVETLDDAAELIMPDGTPTLPTPTLVDTLLVPGSSFTFTTATIKSDEFDKIIKYVAIFKTAKK